MQHLTDVLHGSAPYSLLYAFISHKLNLRALGKIYPYTCNIPIALVTVVVVCEVVIFIFQTNPYLY